MTDESWPSPPREPGPWAGGPPVAPAGSSSIPPLTPGSMLPSPPAPSGGPTPGHGSGQVYGQEVREGAGPISGPLAPPPGSTMWAPAAIGNTPGSSVFPGAPAPSSHNSGRAPILVRGLSAAIVLAVIAGAVFMVANKESPYPSDWDPRVAPLAAWVEDARELKFDHPVHVRFLTPAQYSAESTGDVSSDADLKGEDEAAMNESIGMLRALGLVEGKVDLTAASNTLTDSGTLAFYDPVTKTIFVRGTELTPSVRVTLAHELVHAVQDQNFDLGRLSELESGAATTLRALAEGDAGRIEDIYIEKKLTQKEQVAYFKESEDSYDDVSDEIDDQVPPALSALFASPYIFGPRLIDFLFATGGTASIDSAFEDPPSEFALFDPVGSDPAKSLASEQVILEVNAPEGAKTIDDGSFGPTSWYLVLAARLDPLMALTATDGITADGYVNYRKKDLVCVSAEAKADDKDLAELTSALKEWAAKSPEGSAEVIEDDGTVTLRSCDPGETATGLGTVSIELLIFAAARTDAYVAWITDGADVEQATCFSQGLVDEFTIDEILDGQFEPQRIEQLAMSCS